MNLEKDHHFVRYCKPSQCENDEILTPAFHLRKKGSPPERTKDEETLSVDWYEFFSKDHYSSIIKALNKRRRGTKPKGYLAKLNVGKTIEDLRKIPDYSSFNFYIENAGNSSHSEFYSLYGIDEDIRVCDTFIKNIIDKRRVVDI